jgi:septal ring factor EnvC (AmiA/AmiB activator)
MKWVSSLLLLCLLSVSFLQFSGFVYADELDDIEKKLSELSKAREMSVNATKPLEGHLDQLSNTLKSVQNSIIKIEGQILLKQK